ncbi:MAG: Sugar phosphatase YidA [Fimbriimonadaceae bacterium]|nr:Sugar phosphatase YidA [Fimbriimonadaceae bacterium]
MSRIRLIAVDLDGTLLGPDRQPNADSAAALVAAQEAGISIVLASGRMAPSIRAYASAIGLRGPIIACNGGLATLGDGSPVFHRPLADHVRNRLLDYAQEHDVHVNVYEVDRTLSIGDGIWAGVYASRLTNVSPQKASIGQGRQTTPTKMMLVDDHNRIQRHRQRLSDIEQTESANVVVSEPEYLEFLGFGVDKGLALAVICERLGVAQDEAAAIGDYENDLGMLRWAGYAGAVENAIAEAKALANVVVSTNVNGGVAEFVRSIV